MTKQQFDSCLDIITQHQADQGIPSDASSGSA